MQRDVAAVVDVGAGERRSSGHHVQYFLGDRARDRRHRRNEPQCVERRHRSRHPPRDDALRPRRRRRRGRAQQRQFVTELVEHRREPPPSRRIRRFDGAPPSPKASRTRSIGPSWKCQAPVGEASMNRRLSHVTLPTASPRPFAGRGGVRGLHGKYKDLMRRRPRFQTPRPMRSRAASNSATRSPSPCLLVGVLVKPASIPPPIAKSATIIASADPSQPPPVYRVNVEGNRNGGRRPGHGHIPAGGLAAHAPETRPAPHSASPRKKGERGRNAGTPRI